MLTRTRILDGREARLHRDRQGAGEKQMAGEGKDLGAFIMGGGTWASDGSIHSDTLKLVHRILKAKRRSLRISQEARNDSLSQ